MLTIALMIRDDAKALKGALSALADVMTPKRSLVLIDQGSQDGSRESLRHFMARYGGLPLALDGPLSLAEGSALARKHTGADYVLSITCADRVSRKGLERLEQILDNQTPELVIMGAGWWLTHPDHPLPGPDAGRISEREGGEAALALYPDPRRFLIRGGECNTPDPLSDPRLAWSLWQRHILGTQSLHLLADPVLLRPAPRHGAATNLDAVATLVAEASQDERVAVLNRAMLWAGDALTVAPADSAVETLAAGQRLLRALPWSLRRKACAASGPAGALLAAIRNGDNGLAVLGMLSAAWGEAHYRGLAAEYASLRHDLLTALPGPEYLRDLHERLRWF